MTPPVDSNDVLITDENSFIRLSLDGGKTQSDRPSTWRVLWCPAAVGHALFVQSQVTENQVRIYSDKAAVARWLQRTIETLLFSAFADTHFPVIDLHFTRAGDRIRLTWYDDIEPFVLTMPPGYNNRPLGMFSTFFPARFAQLEINGRFAAGQPWPETRGDRPSSSACLARSQTWVKPRKYRLVETSNWRPSSPPCSTAPSSITVRRRT
jgi:hypothetical protein